MQSVASCYECHSTPPATATRRSCRISDGGAETTAEEAGTGATVVAGWRAGQLESCEYLLGTEYSMSIGHVTYSINCSGSYSSSSSSSRRLGEGGGEGSTLTNM